MTYMSVSCVCVPSWIIRYVSVSDPVNNSNLSDSYCIWFLSIIPSKYQDLKRHYWKMNAIYANAHDFIPCSHTL